MGIADELQKLEQLHQSGALTDEEFKLAKTRLLSPVPKSSVDEIGSVVEEQLSEIRYQNELMRIDREWDIERGQFLVTGRYGRPFVPTIGTGIGTAIVGGIFGAGWLALAFTFTDVSSHFGFEVGPFATISTVFPWFGILFMLAAFGRGIYLCVVAQNYNSAYNKYRKTHQEARESGRFQPDSTNSPS